MIWSKKKEEIKPSASNTTVVASAAESSVKAPAAPSINKSADPTIPAPISLSSGMIERPASRMPENVRSVLSEGTVINGRLTFDTPVKIDGKLSGEVFSSDVLVVGKTGKIDAKIDVQTLVVQGQVSGEVRARDTIEVVEGGVLTADVTTKKLIIRDAVFSGACKMS